MLVKWSPFNGGLARSSSLMPGFDDLLREADTLLRASLDDVALPSRWTEGAALVPPADVLETESEIQVKVDLPGHDPKSIQVKLEGDTLTIQSERTEAKREEKGGYLRAERRHGVYARSFVLPNLVDGQRCEARFENGVLSISVPKREEAKPRVVDVKVQT